MSVFPFAASSGLSCSYIYSYVTFRHCHPLALVPLRINSWIDGGPFYLQKHSTSDTARMELKAAVEKRHSAVLTFQNVTAQAS
jgi:hypothetical protein